MDIKQSKNNCSDILGMCVHVTSRDDVASQVFSWTTKSQSSYICVANVHMCMEAHDNPDFRQVLNNADLVIPDGRPLVWAQKMLGCSSATQVRGTDLTMNVCKEAEKQAIPIGIYGGSPDTLADLLKFFKNEFPRLQIPFFSSPPFRKLTSEEKENYIQEINTSGARILFVGLGCPKQEKWMAEHKDKLSCVMIGVGAAFDFLAGHKKNAPRWMQKIGLEWFFRLACEPRRLWKRYFKHNPRFVWYFGKQLIREKVRSEAKKKD